MSDSPLANSAQKAYLVKWSTSRKYTAFLERSLGFGERGKLLFTRKEVSLSPQLQSPSLLLQLFYAVTKSGCTFKFKSFSGGEHFGCKFGYEGIAFSVGEHCRVEVDHSISVECH